MRRISCNLILAVGLILTMGWTAETFAAGSSIDVKRPKNAGILSVQVTFNAPAKPSAYRVLVDGVEVGLAGNSTPAEFYLSPGIHKVEIEGPNNQVFVREVEIRRGVKNCICLRVVERTDKRPCPYDIRVDAPEEV
ncbi:MAG TPA: PEGA domain-containing protein, partial [Pyrinomonadaceae bacterium]